MLGLSRLCVVACGLLANANNGLAPIPNVDEARPPGQVRGDAAMGDGLWENESVAGDYDVRASICADGETLDGIDVSKWQGAINWNAVADDGIVFAFVRVSDGLQYIDEYFDDNWAAVHEVGIYGGVYQFFRPGQDPIAQAQLLLERMGPLGPDDLPPVIDVEATDGLPPAQVNAAVHAWVDHVEAALGVMPIIYTGKYFWQDNVGTADFADYPLWIAQYGPVCPDLPNQWNAWVFHQTSASGTVAGVSGDVDTNKFNGDLDRLKTWTGVGGPVCGDGVCEADETADNCAVDCLPCGFIPAAGGTVDDGDACFIRFGLQAGWHAEEVGIDGGLQWTHTSADLWPDNYGLWKFEFEQAGTYEVEVYLEPGQASSQAAHYTLEHAQGVDEVELDQAGGSGWSSLGVYTFVSGAGQQLRLDDNTGAAGEVLVFDAVRLTPADPPDTTGGESSGGSLSGTDPTGDDSSDASGSATGESATATSEGANTTDPGADGDGGCACRAGSSSAVTLWGLGLLGFLRYRRKRR